MIIDEKVLSPPPPYSKANAAAPAAWRTFAALPPHLLLQIVYATFSDAYEIEDAKEQRKTLYWLSTGLRLVNRLFYTTSMNVLRSVYLPVYDSLIRAPYTSDPFPHNSHSQSSHTSISSLQRETATLDLFIALKVREDVWSDDSELHLERDESFTDLFNLMQPRSRLEDLVREYGLAEGVVYIDRRRARSPAASSSSIDLRASQSAAAAAPTQTILRSAASHASLTARLSTASAASSTSSGSSFWRMTLGKGKGKAVEPIPTPSMKVTITPLAFSALSVSFSSRRVGLVLTTPNARRSAGGRRTVVVVARTRDEQLEVVAQRLVWELRDWLVDGVDGL